MLLREAPGCPGRLQSRRDIRRLALLDGAQPGAYSTKALIAKRALHLWPIVLVTAVAVMTAAVVRRGQPCRVLVDVVELHGGAMRRAGWRGAALAGGGGRCGCCGQVLKHLAAFARIGVLSLRCVACCWEGAHAEASMAAWGVDHANAHATQREMMRK